METGKLNGPMWHCGFSPPNDQTERSSTRFCTPRSSPCSWRRPKNRTQSNTKTISLRFSLCKATMRRRGGARRHAVSALLPALALLSTLPSLPSAAPFSAPSQYVWPTDQSDVQWAVELRPMRELRASIVIPTRFAGDHLHVEWLCLTQSNAPVALLVSTSDAPESQPVLRETGVGGHGRACSEESPCFDAPHHDAASFFHTPGYAFVRVPPGARTLEVLLVFRPREREPDLPGALVVSAAEHAECGARRVLGAKRNVCAGDACRRGGWCECWPPRLGRFCEAEVPPLPRGGKVAAGPGWRFFQYQHKGRKARMQLTVAAGAEADLAEAVVVAKLREDACGDETVALHGGFLPSLRDKGCRARPQRGNKEAKLFRATSLPLRRSEIWYIGVYAPEKGAPLTLSISSCGRRRHGHRKMAQCIGANAARPKKAKVAKAADEEVCHGRGHHRHQSRHSADAARRALGRVEASAHQRSRGYQEVKSLL